MLGAGGLGYGFGCGRPGLALSFAIGQPCFGAGFLVGGDGSGGVTVEIEPPGALTHVPQVDPVRAVGAEGLVELSGGNGAVEAAWISRWILSFSGRRRPS
jgi:hypothetical protein